jgi:hypothetical protein
MEARRSEIGYGQGRHLEEEALLDVTGLAEEIGEFEDSAA